MQLHVISIGFLGNKIAKRIAEYGHTVISHTNNPNEVSPATWPTASIHVLAAGFPVSNVCLLVDSMANKWRVPWLPVIVDHPHLRIGPTVSPVGPCYSCFRRRRLQHLADVDLELSRESYYESGESQGPEGFLDPWMSFAAVVVWELAHGLIHDPENVSGKVYEINMVTLRSQSGNAIGFHGCPRCGLHRNESTRSIDGLLAELAPVLPSRHWGDQ